MSIFDEVQVITPEDAATVSAESIIGLVDPNKEVGVAPEDYKPFVEPAPPAVYTVMKAPGVRKEGVTKDGHPYIIATLVLVDGPFQGRQLDGFFSTTPEKFRPKATSADDLLHAVGTDPYPRTVGGYQVALRDAAGVFEVKTDIAAECFKHKDDPPEIKRRAAVRGWDNFKFAEDGSKEFEVACPVCGEAIVARMVMRRIVMKRQGK